MSKVLRTPVRITGTSLPILYKGLIGSEAIVYSGEGKAAELLEPYVRLSSEAAARASHSYVRRQHLTVAPMVQS